MPLRGSLVRYAPIPCVCDALGRSRRPTADRRSFLLHRRPSATTPRPSPCPCARPPRARSTCRGCTARLHSPARRPSGTTRRSSPRPGARPPRSGAQGLPHGFKLGLRRLKHIGRPSVCIGRVIHPVELVVVACKDSMGRVSLGCHCLSPIGKQKRRDRDVGNLREQVISGSYAPSTPRWRDLIRSPGHVSLSTRSNDPHTHTRMHVHTKSEESSTSTRRTRASTHTQSIAPRARARTLIKLVSTHSADTWTALRYVCTGANQVCVFVFIRRALV